MCSNDFPAALQSRPGLHLPTKALGDAIMKLGTDRGEVFTEGAHHSTQQCASRSDRLTLASIARDRVRALQVLGNAVADGLF